MAPLDLALFGADPGPASGSAPPVERVLSRTEREPDGLLVARIAAGDDDALGVLYERYAPLVFAVARRVLTDSQAQEECTQDVFVQVWRDADRFDAARGTVGSWLVLLARSRAIEHVRRAARRDIPRETVEVAGHEPDLANAVAELDDACTLAAAMATLPVEQYDTIRLAYFEGLAHVEVAQRLGLPLGTVKSRIRLGLDRLRSVAAVGELGREGLS